MIKPDGVGGIKRAWVARAGRCRPKADERGTATSERPRWGIASGAQPAFPERGRPGIRVTPSNPAP